MIGIDIIAIKRIEKIVEQHHTRFLDKFLSYQEQQLANSVATIAGFWAAKEAIAKALQCGIGRELSFFDIILAKTIKNAPYFELSPLAYERFCVNRSNTALSIAHDGGFAIAVAMLSS